MAKKDHKKEATDFESLFVLENEMLSCKVNIDFVLLPLYEVLSVFVMFRVVQMVMLFFRHHCFLLIKNSFVVTMLLPLVLAVLMQIAFVLFNCIEAVLMADQMLIFLQVLAEQRLYFMLIVLYLQKVEVVGSILRLVIKLDCLDENFDNCSLPSSDAHVEIPTR